MVLEVINIIFKKIHGVINHVIYLTCKYCIQQKLILIFKFCVSKHLQSIGKKIKICYEDVLFEHKALPIL